MCRAWEEGFSVGQAPRLGMFIDRAVASVPVVVVVVCSVYELVRESETEEKFKRRRHRSASVFKRCHALLRRF